MSKLIELKNFVKEENNSNEENDIDDESTKLEINNKIDKSEVIDTNAMKNCIFLGIIFFIIFIILSIIAVKYILIQDTIKTNEDIQKEEDKNKFINKNYNVSDGNQDIKPKEQDKPKEREKHFNFKKPKENGDKRCSQYDPINLFSQRLGEKPITVGQSGDSRHICYQNKNSLFVFKNGVICKMDNIVIDPSKWRSDGFIYKGPLDNKDRGCPLLSKGFFNMKSEKKIDFGHDTGSYCYYFSGWNYDYNNEYEDLEELAPGKIIFFISRNQDSPNLYHGGSEFMNALSIMYLLDIKPENIQIIFLESIEIKNDPFYDLYKNLISRGGDPFHISTLKKNYYVTSAIHIPINWDSPCFIYSNIPTCQYPSLSYKYFNDLIDFYMDIKPYRDSFMSDNEVLYYPKSVIEHHKQNKPFKKIVTFQWRRVWPKGRASQERILGNGPELAEKLSKSLPEDILIRLIDTAGLSISEQISIMRNTDYFIGMHGAGLFLGIFTPNSCPFHEVLPTYNMNGLLLMGALSGHRVFSDVIQSYTKKIEGSDYIYFNEKAFSNKIIQRMKESGFI